jgi:uncharacterized glyoxalase superfamily protein PhnB
MEIAAVAVSATDLPRAIAFYELLGFTFPPVDADTEHVESEAGIRLMIDTPPVLEQMYGEAPRPGNIATFALRFDTPDDVDRTAARVAEAGHQVVSQPWDAFWGQRYATVADPDGYRVDLFSPLS